MPKRALDKRTSKKASKAARMLDARIGDRSAKIGVIGLGYVGLPLMLASIAKKFSVLGFDIDVAKVKRLNRGRSPLRHVGDDSIAVARKAKLFEATSDMNWLSEVDVVIICVPTPIGAHREPDLSFVVGTVKEVAERLRPGQLVVLEFDDLPRYNDRGGPAHSRIYRT